MALQAVAIGVAIVLAGTIPRNIVFVFWSYLNGDGPPASTAAERRAGLRANRISGRVWAASLIAGGLGLVALVVALRLANRLVVLPPQALPDLSDVPRATVLALLLMGAPIAGIVEEAAFRGYMQRPIEQAHGIWLAILISGTMFALVHLDFTPILWPYYVAVAAIYGTVAYFADSILPAVVLHTSGNVYSNLDLWLHGQAEWQAPAGQQLLVLTTGPDRAFWTESALLLVLIIAMVLAYRTLAVESGFGRTRGGAGVKAESTGSA